MTIISEDKLTVKDPDRVSFTPLRREVHDAIAADRHLRCAEEETDQIQRELWRVQGIGVYGGYGTCEERNSDQGSPVY